ncbi:MAG: UDP-N-acetylmuramate--L-alanine ligase [Candidatus Coatesbacteria bacterium]|nr:UDP-N-acetylmuramate--L-alanine ligase [Candidatus Coatesbacteria bacterium]
MFLNIKRLHMVGIGGAGMCGIAEILLNLNFKVTGSDLKLSPITDNLVAMGAVIYEGHNASNIGDAEVIVYSSAVDKDNPEVAEAIRRGLPVIRRAEMLGELMRMKSGIGIAGTHGKTTTTSMIGHLLTIAGLDPTVIVGGKVKSFEANAKLGRGEYIVVEACEFDRSFLSLSPVIAIITNIEAEHMDVYANFQDVKQSFVQFANRVPFYGRVIVCLDDAGIQDILPGIDKSVRTYGLNPQANYMATEIKCNGFSTKYRVLYNNNNDLGFFELSIPGIHNVLNSLASIAIANELNIPMKIVAKALKTFPGVHRRFEKIGTFGNNILMDDYAHHPTEIKATLNAVRQYWQGKLTCIFQPHLYSRTKDFKEEFAKSFHLANELIVTDIYPAREEPIPSINGKMVADLAKAFGHRNSHYIGKFEDIVKYLEKERSVEKIVLTIGAGNVNKICQILSEMD